MLLKAGVDISRLKPEIRKKLPIISEVVEQYENSELVITSTYEGTHSPGSLHYGDYALDIRGGSFNQVVVVQLKRELGPDYDVVDEVDHIHIEYDPK